MSCSRSRAPSLRARSSPAAILGAEAAAERFALRAPADVVVAARAGRLLDELDLTYPQDLVIRLLWQRGAVPVKDIGAALALDYGTLSPLLKRLEARGLIRRVRRSDDERSIEITLTDVGDAMGPRAERVPAEVSRAIGLDEQATEELRATLRQLTNGSTPPPHRSAACAAVPEVPGRRAPRDEDGAVP